MPRRQGPGMGSHFIINDVELVATTEILFGEAQGTKNNIEIEIVN